MRPARENNLVLPISIQIEDRRRRIHHLSTRRIRKPWQPLSIVLERIEKPGPRRIPVRHNDRLIRRAEQISHRERPHVPRSVAGLKRRDQGRVCSESEMQRGNEKYRLQASRTGSWRWRDIGRTLRFWRFCLTAFQASQFCQSPSDKRNARETGFFLGNQLIVGDDVRRLYNSEL